MALDSVYSSILDAVAKLVFDLGDLSADQVRIRRRPAFVKEQDDLLPLICVCPEAERVADMTFGNQDHIDYPVTVALLIEGKLKLEDLYWQLHWRQLIRRKLRATTLEAASTVYDVVDYSPGDPFDRGGHDRLFDVSVQRFTYRSVETRNE